MSDPAIRRATYEDLLGVADHLVAEVIDGALITSPRPAARHAWASSSLGGELHGPFMRGKGGPGGWIILDEPELHLQADILVPDLAGWRRERMVAVPEVAFDVAPNWVCEVLSPLTAATDRAEKMPIYAREEVTNLWLVDPIARTLEAYRLEGKRWILLGTWRDNGKVRGEPFAEFELDLEGLWAK
jgi:Uma2 family endonuclease